MHWSAETVVVPIFIRNHNPDVIAPLVKVRSQLTRAVSGVLVPLYADGNAMLLHVFLVCVTHGVEILPLTECYPLNSQSMPLLKWYFLVRSMSHQQFCFIRYRKKCEIGSCILYVESIYTWNDIDYFKSMCKEEEINIYLLFFRLRMTDNGC